MAKRAKKEAGKAEKAKNPGKFVYLIAVPWIAFLLVAALLTIGLDNYYYGVKAESSEMLKKSIGSAKDAYAPGADEKTRAEMQKTAEGYSARFDELTNTLILISMLRTLALPFLLLAFVLLLAYSAFPVKARMDGLI